MLNIRIITLHKPFLFFCFQIFFSSLSAQLFPPKNYPKGYFIYPVQAKIGLAANFGELRPNHFHMGLDCRTDQKENAGIIAAADGYIAQVKIEPGGFGRAIYINHPNGLTTLYAHLNNFFPALEKYVKEQQYKLESWQVFLNIPPNLFPVKQGEFIAFSGNTGGSQGPHLHFEIRNTKTDKVINPSLFGFPVPDNVPPTLIRLAMYDRCISTYSQIPKLYPLKKLHNQYVPSTSTIITNTDRVSFGISAFDRYTGSANPNGIYEATIYFDGMPMAGFQLDNISYNETRYMNAHIDYKLKTGGGPYVQHLSRLPGYPEGVYKDVETDGIIYLEDDSVHQIKIEVKDAYDNISILQFTIRRGQINENKYKKDSSETRKFSPGFVNVFDREDIQVILGENDLYDSINFFYTKKTSTISKSISALHTVHTAVVPVHGHFTIRLKPVALPVGSDKIIMQRTWGSKMDVVKPETDREWYSGKFREFGNFQLLVDSLPPVISPIGIRDNANLSRASQIIFIITDNMKKIKNFRAELDGKWLRFTNDKGRSFIYRFDEKCTASNHELKVSVEDEAGNQTTKMYRFTR
jgi:hypothetical protein